MKFNYVTFPAEGGAQKTVLSWFLGAAAGVPEIVETLDPADIDIEIKINGVDVSPQLFLKVAAQAAARNFRHASLFTEATFGERNVLVVPVATPARLARLQEQVRLLREVVLRHAKDGGARNLGEQVYGLAKGHMDAIRDYCYAESNYCYKEVNKHYKRMEDGANKLLGANTPLPDLEKRFLEVSALANELLAILGGEEEKEAA